MDNSFRKFAQKVSEASGSSWAFLVALSIIIIWAITGPFFNYSATWQLVVNTGTTIITFLMVFLVQNAQNRDTKSIHIKLDELIHAQKRAHNTLIGIENKSDKQLDQEMNKLEKTGKLRKIKLNSPT